MILKSPRFLLSVSLAGGLSIAVLPARADSLFTVPVSGTLQAQRLDVELQQDSGASINSSDTTRFASLSYDWNRYVAVGGIARLTGDFTARPTASVQFAPVGEPYSFAVGIANVGVRTFRSQPYAVGNMNFRSLGGLNAYVGLTHDSFGEHVMIGADYPLTRNVGVLADWIGDDGNFFTAGVRWNVIDDFSLSGGFLRANSHDSGNGVFLSADKGFHL
jgi:hypothetical protein